MNSQDKRSTAANSFPSGNSFAPTLRQAQERAPGRSNTGPRQKARAERIGSFRTETNSIVALFVVLFLSFGDGVLLAEPKPFDPQGGLAARGPESEQGGAYVVKSGDTLWDLALRFLGNPFSWRSLFNANSGKINNPNLIYPGQKFRIPGGKEAVRQAATRRPGKADIPGKADSGQAKPAQGNGEAFQVLPLSTGRITSDFGRRKSPCSGCSSYHQGVDIGAPRGTPVRATGPGRVVHAGPRGGGGNTVIIDHGNGYQTVYMHLQHGSFRVKTGDRVTAGQQVAGVNSTGNSTGDHLHFSVMQGGKYIDPQSRIHIPPSL